MRKYFLFVAMVAFISCNQNPKKEEPKLKFKNFVFANYRWTQHAPYPDTSWDFNLNLYVNILPNGVARIKNIQYDSSFAYYKYYEDTLPDSLINHINRLLENKKFEKTYPYKGDAIIYDGGPYYLSFTAQDSIKQEIIFSPYSVNTALDSVGYYIVHFITDTNTLRETKPFNTDSIAGYLKSYSLTIMPLPPRPNRRPPKIEMKQFRVPEIIKIEPKDTE